MPQTSTTARVNHRPTHANKRWNGAAVTYGEWDVSRRGGISCSSDGSGCLLAGLRALARAWCVREKCEPARDVTEALNTPLGGSRRLSGASSASARDLAPLKRAYRADHEKAARSVSEDTDSESSSSQDAAPRRRIMAPCKAVPPPDPLVHHQSPSNSYDGSSFINGLYHQPSETAPGGVSDRSKGNDASCIVEDDVGDAVSDDADHDGRGRRAILKRSAYALPTSQSATSLSGESDATDFDESETSIWRAERGRRVAFVLERNEEHEITALRDMNLIMRRALYWQPEEYAVMSQNRMRLERAVLRTGGRVRIEGESRRGLGLVCEPETRLARASKIQQTQRAVLRMHADGASASRLAKFAADASGWATRNALICAHKDFLAALEPETPLGLYSSQSASLPLAHATNYVPTPDGNLPPPPAFIPRCDSNTAETNGLASMIRNDSLGNLADSSIDAIRAYARARRRLPSLDFPAKTRSSSSVSAVSA